MTEALEIRTLHADVSDVVRELAPGADDESIKLPCERPIADGEWVTFTVLLNDGTAVFEGVGRSQGMDAGRIQLSLLSFDERSEVIYERLLLARDAGEEDPTNKVAVPASSPPKSVAPPPLPPSAAKPSTRPPPPVGKRPTSIPPPPGRAGGKLPAPPRTPDLAGSQAKPEAAAAPAKPELAAAPAAKAASARPAAKAPASKPAAKPVSKPASKPASARPMTTAGAADEAPAERSTLAQAIDRLDTPLSERPQHKDESDVVSSANAPAKDGTFRLDVPPKLVARARALAPLLPPEITKRGPAPEQAVLKAAIRLGLASLALLADADDDDA